MMSGTLDPTPDEDSRGVGPSGSNPNVNSSITTPKRSSFKRPHTPSQKHGYADEQERRTFTPTLRPQTPLHRTEIGSVPNLSDCIIPTVQLSATLQEITVPFGSTYAHKPVTRNFRIENMKDSAFILEANVKHLKDTGYSIDFEGASHNGTGLRVLTRAVSPVSGAPKNWTFEIPAKTNVTVPITWLPSKLGKARYTVLFISKSAIRGFRLILAGQVVSPPTIKSQPPTSSNKRPLSAVLRVPGAEIDTSSATQDSASERIKRLRYAYKVNTEPRDLGWLEEPKGSFAELLNFTLCPLDFQGGDQQEAASLAWFSLTWEKLFIRSQALSTKRSLAALFKALHVKISQGALALQKRFNILNNIGLRRDAVRLFLQIEPIWLTLALEVVLNRKGFFGVCFDEQQMEELVEKCLFGHVEEESDRTKAEKRFIEKSLQLLVFVDAARKAKLIPGYTRLFSRLAEVRSTQAFFGQFKDGFLEETDLPLALSFIQTSHDETNLRVNELSQDLRDGVRLSHLACFLTGDWGIIDALHIPASSHQARVDNQCLLFDLLNQYGIVTARMVGGPTRPCDIADGDRKKTLGLLWEIGRWWQLPKLVDGDFFSAEIVRLKLQYRRQFGRRLEDMATEFFDVNSRLVSGLLTWVATVASFFGYKVINFSNSFADGRVLCCLISHYFPHLLPASLILGPPTQEIAVPTGILQSSWDVHSPPKRQKKNPAREAICHNFDLFKRVVTKLGSMPAFVTFRIDGVIDQPIVILYVAHLARRIQTIVTQNRCARRIQTHWRTKCLAQRELQRASVVTILRALRLFYFRQKVLPTYPSFQSIRCAAIRIQTAWRRWNGNSDKRKRQCFAILIQRLYRTKLQRALFLSFQSFLRSTQVLCRGLLARRRLALAREQHRAAIRIQTSIRGYLERLKLKRIKDAVVAMQKARRRFIKARSEHNAFTRLKYSAISLQRIRRRSVANREFIYQRTIAAATLQTMYRGKLARYKLFQLQREYQAATRIQSCLRRHVDQKAFLHLKAAAITVQARRRASILTRVGKETYHKIRCSVLFIQARFRLVRFLKLQQQKRFDAATAIQSHARRFMEAKKYRQLLATARNLQRRRRALVVGRPFRQRYLQTHHAITCLQKLSRRRLFIQHRRHTSAIILQSAWRVHSARKVYNHLVLQKKAAESIQALIRGYFRRRGLATLRRAAIWIQNRRRRCMALRSMLHRFRTTRVSAIVIQQAWRHRKLGQRMQHSYQSLRDAAALVAQRRRQLNAMREQRQDFLELKAAATVSQRVHRLYCFGKRVRKEYVQKKRLVTFIQARRRTFVVRSAYHQLRDKVNVVCCLRRHAVAARDVRVQYAETRQRLIHIQRLFRHKLNGAAIRADYLRSRNAATVIQSFWRMYAQKKAYLQLQQAANLVGTRRRQLVQARDCHYRYMELRCATVTIQHRWRQAQHQKAIHQDYSRLRASTIVIQSHWRRHQLQSRVAQLSSAVQIITHTRRRAVLARQTRCEFALLRTVSIALQKKFRLYRLGRAARAEFTRMRSSAILIQASCRRAIARRDFSQLRSSATLVAERYRLALLSTQVRHEYLTLRKAAIFVQAQRRMAVVRAEHLQVRWAASVISQRRIQATLARRTRTEYNTLLASVVLIQQRYRLIQAGRLVREAYIRSRAAAVTIQAQWRMATSLADFRWLRYAATLVARFRRQALLAREIRRQYLQRKDSSIILQRRYRLVKLGQTFQESYALARRSAITIQAYWRMASARDSFRLVRHAAGTIATKRREVVLARTDRQSYEHLREAVRTIQQGYRNVLHGRAVRSDFLSYRTSTITIQAQWRMVTARRDFTLLRLASSHVALRRRQVIVAREERHQYLCLQSATIAIQTRYRMVQIGNAVRQDFIYAKSCVIKLQAAWRMYRARRHFLSLRQAAILVSQRRRQLELCREAHSRYLSVSSATVFVQRKYRQNLRAAWERRQYTGLKSAAITVQSYWKGQAMRSSFLRLQMAAQCVIERRLGALRARQEYTHFRRLISSTILAQRAFRHYRACARDRARFVLMKEAACKIQGALRAHWQYQVLKAESAILLQSCWRRRQAQAGLRKLKQAASVVRSWYHARTTRAGFIALRLAAAKLQRIYRRSAQIRNHRATQIQQAWLSWHRRESFRAHVAHRLAIRLRWRVATRKVTSFLVLQRHFVDAKSAANYSRRLLLTNALGLWRAKCDAKLAAIREAQLAQLRIESAGFIQVACRGYLARRRLWAAKTIAIRIQSLYRGHLVRKRSHAKVRNACQGVMRACREAVPHMRLRNRTTEALKLLSGKCNYTKCYEACKHLVVVTQISPACRQRLVKQYHSVLKILEFMQTFNRSSPADGIVSLAVMVLENISRDPSCDWGRHVTPKEVDHLLTTMLSHTTPNHILASLLVTFGYLMAHPVGFEAVLSAPQVHTRLRRVHFSMQRHLRKAANMTTTGARFSPPRFANYSIGLTGISSYHNFDQVKLIESFIQVLATYPTDHTS